AKRPLPSDQYDQFAVSGQQQLFRLGWIGVDPTQDAYVAPLFATGSRGNTTGFSVAAVDQLLASARATADPGSRVQLYQQAEQQIMAQAPIVPIAQFETKALVGSQVRGLLLNVDGTFDVTRVSLHE